MNESSISTSSMDDEELFKSLKKKPLIAVPTVSLLIVCDATIAVVWYLALTDQISLWLGCLINTIAMYYLFSPMHDAMHQAVSSKSSVNNLVLALTTFPIAPFTTGQFMRMMHMQHHRFANGELDPDHEVAKNITNAFSKWFIWGHLYRSFYAKNKDNYPEFNKKLLHYDRIVGLVGLVILFIAFPAETLLLMFIPGVLFSWLIAFVFMYLPHRPHNVEHASDPYRATLIREGWEWLLCPLMAYQNYHLVHHLYPTVPFYRYKKVWEARKNFHMSKNPAIVSAFQLDPAESK